MVDRNYGSGDAVYLPDFAERDYGIQEEDTDRREISEPKKRCFVVVLLNRPVRYSTGREVYYEVFTSASAEL